MSTVTIKPKYLEQLAALDAAVLELNKQKIRLLFKALGIKISAGESEHVLEWVLIILTVRDKQMAVQLNKLCAYVPNLKFVVDTEQSLFTLVQGIRQGGFGKSVERTTRHLSTGFCVHEGITHLLNIYSRITMCNSRIAY